MHDLEKQLVLVEDLEGRPNMATVLFQRVE